MVNWNEVIQELNDLGFRNNELIEFNMREEDTEEDSIDAAEVPVVEGESESEAEE